MTLKQFEASIKNASKNGWKLSRRDIVLLKDKYHIRKDVNEKAEKLLDKYGYNELMFVNYQRKVNQVLNNFR